jgi:hypothetical protein
MGNAAVDGPVRVPARAAAAAVGNVVDSN